LPAATGLQDMYILPVLRSGPRKMVFYQLRPGTPPIRAGIAAPVQGSGGAGRDQSRSGGFSKDGQRGNRPGGTSTGLPAEGKRRVGPGAPETRGSIGVVRPTIRVSNQTAIQDPCPVSTLRFKKTLICSGEPAKTLGWHLTLMGPFPNPPGLNPGLIPGRGPGLRKNQKVRDKDQTRGGRLWFSRNCPNPRVIRPGLSFGWGAKNQREPYQGRSEGAQPSQGTRSVVFPQGFMKRVPPSGWPSNPTKSAAGVFRFRRTSICWGPTMGSVAKSGLAQVLVISIAPNARMGGNKTGAPDARATFGAQHAGPRRMGKREWPPGPWRGRFFWPGFRLRWLVGAGPSGHWNERHRSKPKKLALNAGRRGAGGGGGQACKGGPGIYDDCGGLFFAPAGRWGGEFSVRRKAGARNTRQGPGRGPGS